MRWEDKVIKDLKEIQVSIKELGGRLLKNQKHSNLKFLCPQMMTFIFIKTELPDERLSLTSLHSQLSGVSVVGEVDFRGRYVLLGC